MERLNWRFTRLEGSLAGLGPVVLNEVVALVVAFSAIMVLVLKRVNQALAVFAGVLALGLLTMLPPLGYVDALVSVLGTWSNYDLLVSIGLIGCLGNLLKDTGIMADLMAELRKVLSPRSIVALIPAIMGLLPMPGGALLSAPMIEGEADKLGVSGELKTFLNVAFRHIWFFILPLSSGIIFEVRFSHLDLSTLVMTQLPLFFILLLLSSFVTVMTVRSNRSADGGRVRVVTLVSCLGPIVAAIMLNFLGVPLYLALLPGFFVVFSLKRYPRGEVFRKVYRGIPWTLVAATFGILLFRAVSDETGAFTAVFHVLQGLGVSPLLFAIGFALTVGFVAALPTTAIPLVFPLVLPLLTGMRAPVAVAVVYSSVLTGYFISPLHMCLLLTNGYYGASLPKTYRYWLPVALATFVIGIGSILLIGGV